MIIACPSCETEFAVDAALIPAKGRKVRCQQCAHVWLVSPSGASAEPAAAPIAAAASISSKAPPADTPAAAPPPFATGLVADPDPTPEMIWAGTDLPKRRPARNMTWSIAFAAGAAFIAACVVFRQAIALAVPATGPIYAAIGLPVDTTGLAVVAIKAESVPDGKNDGATTLVVTGTIANLTTEERAVPKIEATLLDEKHVALHSWSFDPGVASLKPGERHDFKQVLAQPPANTYEVRAVFEGGTS